LDPFLRPSSHLLLGTDELGRNEFGRILLAARVAVLAALEAVAIAGICGTVLGVLAGYFGGLIDEGLSRIMDLLFAVPAYLMAVVVVVILGPGLGHAALAIGIVFVPQFGRIARAATTEVRGRAYIEAARLSGRGPLYIMVRHVLPNIASPTSVMVGLTLANAEGTYALLSYLGYGVAPPAPDYGSMLAAGQGYLTTDPWLVLFPSIALVLLILGFVFVGDWMRERFDPHGVVLAKGALARE
jgi:ABC-type dipeptide/oligopeptide/nickel transport system permease subunit